MCLCDCTGPDFFFTPPGQTLFFIPDRRFKPSHPDPFKSFPNTAAMAHLEASAANSQGAIAIAQLGPITLRTQPGSSVVHASGLFLPGAYQALHAQFGPTPSPLEVPQVDDIKERKIRFRQEQTARRQLALQTEEPDQAKEADDFGNRLAQSNDAKIEALFEAPDTPPLSLPSPCLSKISEEGHRYIDNIVNVDPEIVTEQMIADGNRKFFRLKQAEWKRSEEQFNKRLHPHCPPAPLRSMCFSYAAAHQWNPQCKGKIGKQHPSTLAVDANSK